MRKCKNCGAQLDDTTKYCPGCGTPVEDSSFMNPAEGSFTDSAAGGRFSASGEYAGASADSTGFMGATMQNPVEEKRIHMFRGILGAFLFSLAGVAVYIILYMLGYVAWISAAVMLIAAEFGYRKLSGSIGKTTVGVIIAAIVTIIMILVAEYICVGIDLFMYADAGLSLPESFLVVPVALQDSEFMGYVLEDLAFMYIVGAVIFIFEIFGKRFKRR